MTKSTNGFTIVELLIVIVVIAILAAISIVAYTGIQQKARVGAVSSGLSQAARKLAAYQVENADQYPAAAGTNGMDNLIALGINNTNGVTYQYSATSNTYCLTATNGSTSYKLSNANTTPASGGCAGHAQGGAPAITNLATNPSFETASGTVNGQPGLAGVSWHSTNGSFAYQTGAWAQSGTKSLHISPSTNGSVDTFAQIPNAWFTSALQPGSKVSVAAYLRLAQAGSATQDGRARRIHLVVNTPGGNVILQTSAAPNAAGVHLVRGVLTVPSDFTSLSFARLYNGHSDVDAQWDSLIVVAGDYPNLTPKDGGSTDWIWNGTANNATSTGPSA